MKKRWFLLIIIPLFLNCALKSDNWKELDLSAFKISIPQNWKYQKAQGEDSFVGIIKTPNASLQFDCSSMGYANHLTPTENEYLKSDNWLIDCPFCKRGITYTANFNVKNEKARQMKEKGITDSTLVKVEADPSYQTKTNILKPTSEQIKKYPKADYIAELTYHDSTIYIPIELPLEIKMENTKIDTTADYIVKTIWPKKPGKGITGVYIKKKTSNFNFNMVGINLPENEENLALRSFKTIKIK